MPAIRWVTAAFFELVWAVLGYIKDAVGVIKERIATKGYNFQRGIFYLKAGGT